MSTVKDQLSIELKNAGEIVSQANPLSVNNSNTEYIDLVNNPSTIWSIRPDGQADYEEITFNSGPYSGRIFRRTFTFVNNILTARSQWNEM